MKSLSARVGFGFIALALVLCGGAFVQIQVDRLIPLTQLVWSG